MYKDYLLQVHLFIVAGKDKYWRTFISTNLSRILIFSLLSCPTTCKGTKNNCKYDKKIV